MLNTSIGAFPVRRGESDLGAVRGDGVFETLLVRDGGACLVASQLRRLTRSAGVALIPSALTGGLLLLAADWAAQHAFGVQLPVGVMTVSIGGLYFIWLLIREGRK